MGIHSFTRELVFNKVWKRCQRLGGSDVDIERRYCSLMFAFYFCPLYLSFESNVMWCVCDLPKVYGKMHFGRGNQCDANFLVGLQKYVISAALYWLSSNRHSAKFLPVCFMEESSNFYTGCLFKAAVFPLCVRVCVESSSIMCACLGKVFAATRVSLSSVIYHVLIVIPSLPC